MRKLTTSLTLIVALGCEAAGPDLALPPLVEEGTVGLPDPLSSWYYQRTIVDSSLPAGLAGLSGPVQLVRWSWSEDELNVLVMADGQPLQRWAVLERTDNGDVRIDWDDARLPQAELSPGVVLTGLPGAEVFIERDAIQLITPARLALDPQRCGSIVQQRLPLEHCEAEVQVHHSFLRAGGRSFVASERWSERFELLEANGHKARFSLWVRERDDTGNQIPFVERTPAAIDFYLSHDFPSAHRAQVQAAINAYDQALSALVQDLTGQVSVPRMVRLWDNGCRLQTVQAALSQPKALQAVAQAVCDGCEEPRPISQDALPKACAALEALERHPSTGAPSFVWQRPGDLRYNVIAPRYDPGPWGVRSKPSVDPKTGRILKSDLWVRIGRYERLGARIHGFAEDLDRADPQHDPWRSPWSLILSQEQARLRAERLAFSEAQELLIEQVHERLQALPRAPLSLDRLNALQPALPESTDTLESIFSDRTPEGVLGWWTSLETPLGRLQLDPHLSSVQRLELHRASLSGASFLKGSGEPGYAQLYPTPEGAAEGLLQHALLHGLGLAFGLRPNLMASYDALNITEDRASVMDQLPALQQLRTQTLGAYDVAALRYLYAHQVQVFERAALGGEALALARIENGAQALDSLLCGGPCESPLEVRWSRRWAWPKSYAPTDLEVPYLSCSTEQAYLHGALYCSAYDQGLTQRAIFASAYERWLGDFMDYAHFRREGAPQIEHVARPLRETLAHAQRAVFGLRALGRTDTPQARDLVASAAHGLNLALEVWSMPAAGEYCQLEHEQNQLWVSPSAGGSCDNETERIYVPSGVGRITGGWAQNCCVTNDCYEPCFAGPFWDQEAALIALGLSLEDVEGPFTAGLSDLFTPQLERLFDVLLGRFPAGVHADLPAAWLCPREGGQGVVQPPAVLDLQSGTLFPKARDCPGGALIFTSHFNSSRAGFALLWYRLHMARAARSARPELEILREPEDGPFDPDRDWCEVIDGDVTYRALRTENTGAYTGCALLGVLQEALDRDQEGHDFYLQGCRKLVELAVELGRLEPEP